MSKKIVVAGGAGFIGSHLCKRLVDKGNQVIALDNFITGHKRNVANINPELFTLIEHDITKPFTPDHSELLKDVTHIYHLASPASPKQYQNNPLETLLVNSIGTQNLLELSVQTGAIFLYASTSEVYGDPLEHPQKETYWGNVNSYGSRSCYDEAKRFGEALIYTYVHKNDVNARIIRLFNTYGPHMEKDDGRVVSNFINQSLSQKPLTMYGDGKQTRSFCYVSDMVEGLIKAIETENTKGEIINLGNPDERPISEIASLIKQLTTTSSPISYHEKPEDDPVRRKPDITKAKKLLQWEPQVKLEDGLKKTIEYFRSTLSQTS